MHARFISKLARVFYVLGVSCLLSGMLLSLVNVPVSATNGNPAKKKTATPAPTLDPPEALTAACEVTDTNTPTPTKTPKNSCSASLGFTHSGSSCSESVVYATVCNQGSGDMNGPVSWDVYFNADGPAKDGSVVHSGTLQLDEGQCKDLSYDTHGVAGNYIFKAYQEACHAGIGQLWSNEESYSCSTNTPTNTKLPTFTPTHTFTPTNTDVPTETFTPTPTEEDTATSTLTFTPTPTDQDTDTSTLTFTPTPTDEDTATSTLTPTETFTPTFTGTATETGTPTETFTPTTTSQYTATDTPTPTQTSTPTEKLTPTPTESPTATTTSTSTLTPTFTQTPTSTATTTITLSPDLNLAFECGFHGANHYTWLVTNPNAFDVDFTWKVAGKSESGHGSVGGGSETTFKTSLGYKTVRLYVDGEQVDSAISDTGDYEFCLYDLSLNQTCNSSGGITWSIKNRNDFNVDFTAELGNNTIDDTVGDNSTYHLDSSSGAHTLDVSWSHDLWSRHESLSSSSDSCQTYPVFPNLGLVYNCADDGINWTASNANNDAVYFVWRWVGSDQGGSGFIQPHSAMNFFKTARGSQEMLISWYSGSTQKMIDLVTDPQYCSNVTSTPLPTQTPLPTHTPTPTITPTRTMTPTSTNTFAPTFTATTISNPAEVRIATSNIVPTLPVPESGGNVLIPVTGADYTLPSGYNLLQTTLVNTGLLFLGIALVLQGVSRKFTNL